MSCSDDGAGKAGAVDAGGALDTYAASAVDAGIAACTSHSLLREIDFERSADLVVPYDGGSLALGFPSVDASMAGWSDRLHCDATEPIVFYEVGDAFCVRHSGYDAPLGLCTIDGGGHNWPGGTVIIGRGKVGEDLDPNAMIMRLLQDAI